MTNTTAKTLRIVHISDMHGTIPSRNAFNNLLEIADLIVLSGDILPNSTRGIVGIEQRFQTEWLHGRAAHPIDREYLGALTPLERWAEFLGNDLPVLIVGGNHDFISMAGEVKGIRGKNCTTHDLVADGPCEFFGLRFAGIAAIPWINGEWNNEALPRELRAITYDLFDQNPDVIVSHSPPSGILAGPYGSDALTNCLSYRDHKIKAVLFGHAHEDGGKTLTEQVNESTPPILFSNAACHVSSLKLTIA